MVRSDKPVSAVLDEALWTIYYEGWTWRGVSDPGFCLTAAIHLANHGHTAPTEDLPRDVVDRVRLRGNRAVRVVLDAIYPDAPHEEWEPRRARRTLENWQDEFGRQECEVLAALRRAAKLAVYREDIGILR